jgi:tetratricopeptide (TPR) repeat protein/tRNA A-37 threonylcarbamoyl transferase component Bud32
MADARTSAQTIGRRYVLQEKLGQGGMGAVYRAYDRLTGQQVALKHVTLEKENLRFASRATSIDVEVALAQEFKTLASLRHPHIISVLDYGFDENLQPYFTMELLENAQDIIEAGSSLSQDEQVMLLVQALQALAYLHRHGIVHRDLKPDNVLVINGQVKVLDFGLAAAQEYLTTSEDVVAGTLAYMAPEVLQGQPASVASDLYAVGVMAYELFAEKYMFEMVNVTRLINDIIFTEPDVPSLGLDSLLQSVLTRLLAKDPAQRFADARELIKIYADATDQAVKYETDTIRESFLQAARFVGREQELSILSQALQEAQNGQGSTWLVGGESGVGKSRLLEELRTQALVQGALAVRGGAISDGGTPYQVWREPVRRLVLETDLSDSEAAVLKPLVPDISRLLDRPIPDAPELDPQAAQDRLINAIEDLLRRQSQPLAIMLEDLHWAGSESILALDRLSRINDIPTLIVGNYRDDEAPALPTRLPQARTLKLERLEATGIRKLSESMLGEAGRRPDVVDLLQRETEGNIFFIVEVVRTLAEEAGQLDLVGVKSLPEKVFVGGVDNLIQRRLQRVPASAFPLLQYAAIIGRQIDLNLLRHLNPSLDEVTWLADCADAAVLEVHDANWRFAHDKFREALLRNLPSERHEQLHRDVAERIEQVYQHDLAAHFAVLAHYWTEARVPDKAISYLEKAGTQALENFANAETLEFFTDALKLAEASGAVIDTTRRARWQRQIGQAYWGLGNLEALQKHGEEALRLHGQPLPTPSELGRALLQQVGIQLGHRLRAPRKGRLNSEITLELIRTYKLLGQAFFFMNQANPTVHATLQQLNLAECIHPSPELSEAYANMCIVAALIPMHSLARIYIKNSIEVAETLNDTYIIGMVSSVISLYYLGIGQWQTARQYIHRSITIADEIGDRRLWESVSGVLALVNSFEGKFADAIDVFNQVYHSSIRSGNTQTYLWGMLGQAENLLPSGRFEDAQTFLDEASTVPMHKFGRDSEIRSNALNAVVSLRRDNQTQALQFAEATLKLISQAAPTSSWLMQHYAAAAQIFLTLWETGAPVSSTEALQQSARQACRIMTRFARIFPIGKARAALCQGWLEYLQGKKEKAQQTWERAIAVAIGMGMPYEEALLHFELGRKSQQAEHLRRALALFEQLEASYYVEHTRALLNVKN